MLFSVKKVEETAPDARRFAHIDIPISIPPYTLVQSFIALKH